ncbi:hypothetical protein NQ314_010080 [Rhamnusium bicolor]|uniref:PiggyBac transposable element-derived protein domain-containing protein n=1 Tax=Rhamnusium bicolor TaxID=1586634 RepID=A0AAV8XTD6_9CUCU|nr:hypothetical protein NQ314_010080 [Rhamnusium bicolor]
MIVDDLEEALEDENMESDGNNDEDNTGNDCDNNVNTCDDESPAKAVNDYRRCMGGIDRAHMIKSYHAIDRKSRKWWHRSFWHFKDRALVNSFIISKQATKNGLKLKDFRLEVISGLVGANRMKRDLGRRSMSPFFENSYKVHVPKNVRTDQAKHMPVYGTSRRYSSAYEVSLNSESNDNTEDTENNEVEKSDKDQGYGEENDLNES